MNQHGTQLVLASRSPRRRQLLAAAGYQFAVVHPRVAAECGVCSRESPAELVARLAWQKARDVALGIDHGLVLGCDTVAECQGQILGKPDTRERAREMLRVLQGSSHRVLSGICLWRRPDDKTAVEVDVTQLRMDALSDRQIEQYLDTDKWCEKAGAFGYQDGLDWVHIEQGSASNVVGLPLELLESMLRRVASGEWQVATTVPSIDQAPD
jgi:septum formation protein